MKLTQEQLELISKHLQRRKKQRLSSFDYIYQNEVQTGICLLDQPIEHHA